jgi:hypothetical protein
MKRRSFLKGFLASLSGATVGCAAFEKSIEPVPTREKKSIPKKEKKETPLPHSYEWSNIVVTTAGIPGIRVGVLRKCDNKILINELSNEDGVVSGEIPFSGEVIVRARKVGYVPFQCYAEIYPDRATHVAAILSEDRIFEWSEENA